MVFILKNSIIGGNPMIVSRYSLVLTHIVKSYFNNLNNMQKNTLARKSNGYFGKELLYHLKYYHHL